MNVQTTPNYAQSNNQQQGRVIRHKSQEIG